MSRFGAHCYYKQDRHQTPNDCSSGCLMTCLYGNFVRQLWREVISRVNQRQPHSGASESDSSLVLWCVVLTPAVLLWTPGRALSSLALKLQASSAALCTEKSNAVNRYQFNRHVTMSLVSCLCAIKDERSLRATHATDNYLLNIKFFQAKRSLPRQNATEWNRGTRCRGVHPGGESAILHRNVRGNKNPVITNKYA